MKNTMEHLPDSKQKELSSIVSIIRADCDDVEMIILFGSYARGDYKAKGDLSPTRKSGHMSDYDILVITEHKETVDRIDLWEALTNKLNQLRLSACARIITHDIQETNIKLAEGHFFFSDIKKEGCLLFDTGNFELVDQRELTPIERQRIAQDHFDHWFEKAEVFLEDFTLNLNKMPQAQKYLNQAAFHLHQAAESSYKSVLLVITNYNPNEHYLRVLGNMAEEEEEALKGIFPCRTDDDIDRFNCLEYAYIGGRYDPKYQISKRDLEILGKSVKKLLELTETVCKQKIQSMVER
jgi:uncharacterized protein